MSLKITPLLLINYNKSVGAYSNALATYITLINDDTLNALKSSIAFLNMQKSSTIKAIASHNADSAIATINIINPIVPFI